MNNLETPWKPFIRRAVTGRWDRLRMAPGEPPFPVNLVRPGLYLHVPFCEEPCPFCPYNRVRYQEGLYGQYERAVHQEIDLYAPWLSEVRASSLYIGGGTPTIHLPGLLRMVDHVRSAFAIEGDICIELHPSKMDDACLAALREAGVTMVSVGVESTSDRILERIGRNHGGPRALDSLRRALQAGFRSVNADLMFCLPGQGIEDWRVDLEKVLETGVDEISTYPLFRFAYSDWGREHNPVAVRKPRGRHVRAFLDETSTSANRYGLKRCAVWSFVREGKTKFSSVTRHHYVGFGPSAASMIGSFFYVNTFHPEEYARVLPEKRPISLVLPMGRRLEMTYWLYWRMYELCINSGEFRELFGKDANLEEEFGPVLRAARAMGWAVRENGTYRVTESGAYWIHRLQNEYSLNYINGLWGRLREEPWPAGVVL